MKDIHLVPCPPDIEQSLHDDPDYFNAMAAEDWGKVADIVHQKAGRRLEGDLANADTLCWGGYLTIDAATREIIGSCAYKSPPTEDGVVEIAYFTYPGSEGRGYATAMAKKLVDLAAGSPLVNQVLAHTLPMKSASTRVLEKASLEFVGEVIDPDDGQVWLWQTRVVA